MVTMTTAQLLWLLGIAFTAGVAATLGWGWVMWRHPETYADHVYEIHGTKYAAMRVEDAP